MKKKLSALALALVLALSLCLTGCGGSDTLTLNVYNWQKYISDGSDGSLDTIHAFEDWYDRPTARRSRSTTPPTPATRTCTPSSKAAR